MTQPPNTATDAGIKYRLTRNFAILSVVVVMIVGALSANHNLEEANERLASITETTNSDLAKVLGGAIWPAHGAFLTGAAKLGEQAIREHSQTAALTADLRGMISGTPVIKIKVYDLTGYTVYSTDLTQIGTDYSKRDGFIMAVRGAPWSALEFREQFAALSGDLADRWVQATYVPLRDPRGNIALVFEIYNDVTSLRANTRSYLVDHTMYEGIVLLLVIAILMVSIWYADRKIAREQARNIALAAGQARAEAASRSKSEFLANMSHELRTPLNAIIGFAEVIKSQAMGPIGTPTYINYVRDIRDSGQHLLGIINNMLDLARMESGQMSMAEEPYDARRMITATIEQARERIAARNHFVAWTPPGDPLHVIGDQKRASQVLNNLIGNALKFTPERSIIHIIANLSEEGDVAITVADHGIGMREEDVPVALSPFGQVDATLARRYEGLGLGLTLSKKLTELMRGTIDIDSAPGQGTRVTVTLPGISSQDQTADAA